MTKTQEERDELNSPFSWEKAIKRANRLQLRDQMIFARLGEPDFKLKHPEEVIDANKDTPNYTILKIRVKNEQQLYQKNLTNREEKLWKIKKEI